MLERIAQLLTEGWCFDLNDGTRVKGEDHGHGPRYVVRPHRDDCAARSVRVFPNPRDAAQVVSDVGLVSVPFGL